MFDLIDAKKKKIDGNGRVGRLLMNFDNVRYISFNPVFVKPQEK